MLRLVFSFPWLFYSRNVCNSWKTRKQRGPRRWEKNLYVWGPRRSYGIRKGWRMHSAFDLVEEDVRQDIAELIESTGSESYILPDFCRCGKRKPFLCGCVVQTLRGCPKTKMKSPCLLVRMKLPTQLWSSKQVVTNLRYALATIRSQKIYRL